MKTAVYIEDGRMQLVLTPDGEYEQRVVSMLAERSAEVRIITGQFYGCQGQYTRQSSDFNGMTLNPRAERSLLIILDSPKDVV